MRSIASTIAGPAFCGVSFSACCRARSSPASRSKTIRRRGQLGLFDDLDAKDLSASRNGGNGHTAATTFLPEVQEMSDADLLAGEKKALGFYLSSHPLTRHAGLLSALSTHHAADLPSLTEKTEVILGGMITNVKERNVQKSRSGLTRMAKLTFEDLSGTAPAMLWPEEFAKMAEFVKDEQIVFVKGTLDRRRDPAELVISRIIPLEKGPAELTHGVVVRLHKGIHQTEHLERLLRLVRVRPGNLDLYLELVGLENVRRAVYRAGASLCVRYDDRLIGDLEADRWNGQCAAARSEGATARVDCRRCSRP